MSAEATVRMRALREAPLWLLAGAVLAFLVADRGTVAPLSPGGPAAALDLSSQVSERAARARAPLPDTHKSQIVLHVLFWLDDHSDNHA